MAVSIISVAFTQIVIMFYDELCVQDQQIIVISLNPELFTVVKSHLFLVWHLNTLTWVHKIEIWHMTFQNTLK